MIERPWPRRVSVVLVGICLTFTVGVRSKEAVGLAHVHGKAKTSRSLTYDDSMTFTAPPARPLRKQHRVRHDGALRSSGELELAARALTQQSSNSTDIGPAAWVMSGIAVHAEEVCHDFFDWTDGEGYGCDTYLQDGSCGAEEAVNVHGTTASAACCGCGGGLSVGVCFDHPLWALSCAYWRASAWCEGDGYGPAWNATANGSFDEHLIAGVPVSEGCCGCGRPATSQPPSLSEALQSYRAAPERVAEIELSRNIGLTGNVPEWIGEFVNLEVLDLSGSAFLEGTLPVGIASLTKLRHLDLSETGLGGELPLGLGDLESLRLLRLRGSFFSGPVPPLGKLSSLEELDLGGNSLTGSIPHSIGGCVALTHLNMEENALTGSIPNGIGSLQLLEVVDLSGNSFYGPLPDAMGNLSALFFFDVRQNSLTGTLPGSIAALTNVAIFLVHHNLMSGTLPDALGGLSAVRDLVLYDNGFSGTLPAVLFQLTTLEKWFMWGNHFSGSIPSEVSQLSNLQIGYFDKNNFRGVVPAELFNHSALIHLGFSLNSELAGSLPSAMNCPSMATLDASDTKLAGSLPAAIGNLKRLQFLWLEDTRLRGAIPGALGNCSSLVELKLTGSRFTSTLPSELARLTTLRFFEVGDNALAGNLPEEYGPAWTQLEVFDVASNMLSGTIAATAIPRESLVKLSLENNTELMGELPSLQLALQLREIFASRCNFTDLLGFPSTLRYLDVSHNSLPMLPVPLYELPLVETLLINDNFMAEWPLKGAYSRHFLDVGLCGLTEVLDSSFVWPSLRLLDVSHNPLGSHVYMFFQTLFWARSLVEVRAVHCGLHGDVPRLVFRETWGEKDCSGIADEIHGFPNLLRLSLQGNLITTVIPEPPPILLVARLDDNRLTHVNRAWFNEGIANQVTQERRFPLSTLSLQSNPSLQFEVAPALSQCGLLPVSSKLTTDPQSFEQQSGVDGETAPYECGVPCSPWGMNLEVDPGIPDESSLCRCKDGHGLLPGQCWDAHWRDAADGLSCSEHVERGHCSSNAEVASVCCDCGGGGGGGNGYNCSQCPQGTYSFSSGDDQHRHRSVCLRCPDNSTTSNETLLGGATSVCDCQCPRGTYLQGGEKCGKTSLQLLADNVSFTGAERCEACGFLKTTLAVGARTQEACVCNTREVDGLQEFWDRDQLTCGCATGYFLNRRIPYCESCKEGTDCRWTSIEQRTAVPPLEVGYWADSAWLIGLPADDPAIEAFGGHNTYRCFSKLSCVDDRGSCALGREGIACSLCKPGFYGGSSGSCTRCTSSGLAGPVVIALVAPPVVIFIHAMLSGQKRTRGCFKKLKKFRISTRQLIKHLQLMAVVSGFTIGWPPDVEKVFETFSFTIRVGDVLDYACLADQQSASLEIVAQLLLPCILVVVGVGVTPWVMMLLRRCFLCLGFKRLDKTAQVMWLTAFDAAKAVFWGILLFYSTLLKNGLALLTCNLHPNGEQTVASFPHLHCPWGKSGADEEWLQMLGPTCLYLVLCIGGVLATYMVALRRTSAVMEQSSFQDRGHLAFLFEDFRDSCVHWPIQLLVRDIFINIIGPLLNNYGATQLLVTAAFCLYIGAKCAKELPYADGSNNVLEILNALSMLIICMFTAGMGFARSPGLQDMVELTKGTSGSELMLTRGRVLLGLQLFSVFGPLAIIGYQFLTLVPGAERILPSMIRPLNKYEQDGLRASLVDTFKVPSGVPLHQLIHRMDARDLQTLSSFVLRLPLASDILHADDGVGPGGKPHHHHHRETIRQFIRSRSKESMVVSSGGTSGTAQAEVAARGGTSGAKQVEVLEV